MKRFLFILALAAAPLPALAGSLTISIASTPITGSKTYTISDADAAAFIAWAQAAYPTTNPDGTTSTPTGGVALGRWSDATMQGTVNNVLSYQKQQAESAASAGVSPIKIQ